MPGSVCMCTAHVCDTQVRVSEPEWHLGHINPFWGCLGYLWLSTWYSVAWGTGLWTYVCGFFLVFIEVQTTVGKLSWARGPELYWKITQLTPAYKPASSIQHGDCQTYLLMPCGVAARPAFKAPQYKTVAWGWVVFGQSILSQRQNGTEEALRGGQSPAYGRTQQNPWPPLTECQNHQLRNSKLRPNTGKWLMRRKTIFI